MSWIAMKPFPILQWSLVQRQTDWESFHSLIHTVGIPKVDKFRSAKIRSMIRVELHQEQFHARKSELRARLPSMSIAGNDRFYCWTLGTEIPPTLNICNTLHLHIKQVSHLYLQVRRCSANVQICQRFTRPTNAKEKGVPTCLRRVQEEESRL